MRLIDAENAEEYLRAAGVVSSSEQASIRPLSGGVSNVVLYVARDGGPDLVLKQARRQLRVPQPWFCSTRRIWREIDVLRALSARLPAPSASGWRCMLPEIVHEDREQFLYVMTAAAADHRVWKEALLAGETEQAIARTCGSLLGNIHSRCWQAADLAEQLGDQSFFDALRLDPYYRQLARVHPDLSDVVESLVEIATTQTRTLVHGDFSPKNLLLFDSTVMLVDFEVGHFGDPAFDVGFFLTHLVLKAFRGPEADDYLRLVESFWDAYEEVMRARPECDDEWPELELRVGRHFAGCLLARLDGKSPVDYLDGSAEVPRIRQLARRLLREPPGPWPDCLQEVRRTLNRTTR